MSAVDQPDPMLLTAQQAAELLQVSAKTLWNHTAPRGNKIPAVRFGRTVRYDRHSLTAWIAGQLGKSGEVVESSGE